MTTDQSTSRYTCHRDRDGCDDTFAICDPEGKHLVSVPFWNDDPEWAARTEAKARMIVDRLNSHDKRYYSTTSGHAAGIDIAIRSPDGRVICTILGLSSFDDGSGIEQSKADAKLIVDALNASARGQL